ncbi:MAG: efflux RND transporter permease subunit [Candidatus Zixiibacteriota bacterium]|nr:MAG: efflux RND transporter permease subunit [candidate division Zixibacteria bacterium]
MNRIIHFLLRQRLLVILATGIVVVAGIAAWRNLPIDAFPDVTNVQVMVMTEAPGLAPVDVEQRLTFPLELALQGLPRVSEVRSLSKSGLSIVSVVFEDGVDIYFSRQLVFERLQAAREDLPEWAVPELGPISTGLGEIYQYTVESPQRTPDELRTLQDWLIAPQLRALPGVNEVNSFGGFVKQYHILVQPENLQKYRLTLNQVLEAVEANNANAGGDYLQRGWEQAYTRSVGMIGGMEDIENIVLTAQDGTPLYLKDVAEVAIGRQTRQGAVTRDGKGETVAGMVIMLRGENSKQVVDRVKQAIPQIQAGLPADVKISPFYDRTSLIQACLRTVGDALLLGGGFVVLVLFLFLGNARAALVTALSMPLTALIAFILMGWQGVTANLMSLGGLAIAIGMVCDASIVVCENLVRHLAERRPEGPGRAAVIAEAVAEVARPVIFAVLIVIVVFLPLFTLEQMEGKMFKPLALTMIFAMLGSLAVALVVVPVLGSLFVRTGSRQGDSAVLRPLKRLYRPLLARALRSPRRTVLLAAAVFLLSLVLGSRVGTEFLPQLDEGAIAINVVRLPSASLEGSVAVGSFMEQKLLQFPEVQTVVTKTGRAEISEDPMGPEQNDLIIMLHPEREWATGRNKEELVEAMQRELSVVPGVRLSFSQPIALRVNELISGIKSDLAIKLIGPDLEALQEYANEVAVVLQGLDGARDVKIEQISGFSQVEIAIDRRAIARHKINVADVNAMIETAVGGKVATTIVEGQMRFAALVRFPPQYRGDAEALRRLLVPSPEGPSVPLGQLAQIREVEAPAQISRENGMRRVVVECNIRGRDMGGFVGEARDRLTTLSQSLPPGYFLRYGGQFENQERAMQRLSVVVPISIALIFLMLFSTFGNARSALLVLANLPLALAGGIVSIWLLDIPLSVSAVIGFIALFGLAVQNGTVLVAFFNQLRKEGASLLQAVEQGCEQRFRPLMMTTATTALGLIPMILARGSGAEMQRPLAVVVLGGLITSQALTLLVLPALYAWVEGRKGN